MIWHDCKTDPPKKDGRYILIYKDVLNNKLKWDVIHYWSITKEWAEGFFLTFSHPIKWANVDLSEVE